MQQIYIVTVAAWRTTSYNVEVETCKSLTSYLDVKRSVSQISTLDKPYSNVEYNSYELIFMQLIIYLNIQLKIGEIFMYLSLDKHFNKYISRIIINKKLLYTRYFTQCMTAKNKKKKKKEKEDARVVFLCARGYYYVRKGEMIRNAYKGWISFRGSIRSRRCLIYIRPHGRIPIRGRLYR